MRLCSMGLPCSSKPTQASESCDITLRHLPRLASRLDDAADVARVPHDSGIGDRSTGQEFFTRLRSARHPATPP